MNNGIARNYILKLLAVALLSCSAFGANIYVSQNGGTFTCPTAGSQTTFTPAQITANTPGIVAGDTIKVCQSITFSAGVTAMTIPVGGVFSGGACSSKVTVTVDGTNIVWQAPYFSASGAVRVSGINCVLMDGGASGSAYQGCQPTCGAAATAWTIQNTANGSSATYGGAFANQQATKMVVVASCNGCEVRNLNTLQMYQRVDGSTDPDALAATGVELTAGQNNSIHNVTCTWGFRCFQHIYKASPVTSNTSIYQNDISLSNHPFDSGAGNVGDTQVGLQIYANHFHDIYPWSGVAGNHGDCVHVHSVQTNSSITGLQLYNNVCDGDMQYVIGGVGGMTATWFVENSNVDNTPRDTSPAIYGNVALYQTNARGGSPGFGLTPAPPDGTIYLKGITSPFVTNNTGWSAIATNKACLFVSSGGVNTNFFGTTDATLQNNVCVNFGTGIQVADPSSTLAVSNNNIFNGLGNNQMYCQTGFKTLANWKLQVQSQAGAFSCNGVGNSDTASSTSLPSFTNALGANGDFTLTAQTAITGIAVVSPYTPDPNGVTRSAPSIGAFEYSPVTSPYTVTLGEVGTWTGTIVGSGGSPASTVNCTVTVGVPSGTCSESQSAGATPTYTPTVTVGSITGWSGGGCAGTGTCTPTVNSNLTLTMTGNAPVSCTLTFASNSINAPSLASATTTMSGLSGPNSLWFIFGPPPDNLPVYNCPYPYANCTANGQTGNIVPVGSGQYTGGACSNGVCCVGSTAALNVNTGAGSAAH